MKEVMGLADQAEAEEIIRREEEKEGDLKQRRKINGMITGVNTYEDFKDLEDLQWPMECFNKVTVKEGSSSMGERDVVLWKGTNDPRMEKGIAGKYRESFPELSDVEGKTWETLILKSKRVVRGRGDQERERRIHVAEEAEGRDLYRKLEELREHLGEMNITEAAINLEDHMDETKIAKMAECIWRKTDMQVVIFSTNVEEGRKELQKVHQNSAVIVKVMDGNYAETLKKFKNDLIKGGASTEVQKIRSTRSGEMLIELREGKDGLKVEDGLKKSEDLEVRILEKDRGDRKKYVIRDLDAVITKEEIEETFKRTAAHEGESEEVKIISIRRTYGDTQTAIIQLTQDHGRRLHQGGGIRLGVVQGELQEWIDLVRCFKCWGYGHRAPECSGPDRTNHCLRCGAEGHEARDCERELFCPLCQRHGHKAGSGACPKMRDMLNKLRSEAERRKRRRR